MNTRIQNIPSSLALEAQSESFVVSRGSLLNLHSSVLSTIVPRFIEIIVDSAPRGMRREAEGVGVAVGVRVGVEVGVRILDGMLEKNGAEYPVQKGLQGVCKGLRGCSITQQIGLC